MASLVSVTQIHSDSSISRLNWSKLQYQSIHFDMFPCMSLKYDPERTRLKHDYDTSIMTILLWHHQISPRCPFLYLPSYCICRPRFCQFDAMLDLHRKREAQLRNFFWQIGLRTGLWGYFIDWNCCRKSQSTVGGTIPCKGGLGLYRKGRWTSQGKQAIKP